MERIFRKIFKLISTLFLSVSIIFFAVRLAPGDPVEKILGPQAKQEEIIKLRSSLGLDQSLLMQYTLFVKNAFQFEFGESLYKSTNVVNLIKKHFPPSLLLSITSISLSFIVGSLIGVFVAIKKGTNLDMLARVLSLLGLSFPIFALAPILVLIFAINFQVLPVSEWGEFKHVLLPTLTLIVPLSTIVMRVTRNRFLEDMHEPWVQVLQAKGLSNFQIFARVFKVTLPTILNVVAIQLSVVLGGTIITETIFDIPGMGLLLFEAIQNRDYPLIQGVVAFITILYMVVYFLIEYINETLDPRIAK